MREELLRMVQCRSCVALNGPAQTLLELRKSKFFCLCSGAKPWSQPQAHQ